jgi:hypothetical protein
MGKCSSVYLGEGEKVVKLSPTGTFGVERGFASDGIKKN